MMIKIIFVNGEQVEEKMTFCESLIFALGGFVRGYTDSIARVDDMPGLYACIENHIDSLVAEIERAARDEGFQTKEDRSVKKEFCVKDHYVDSNSNLLRRIEGAECKIEEIAEDLEKAKDGNDDDMRYIVASKNLILYKAQQLEKKLEEIEKLNARLNILDSKGLK